MKKKVASAAAGLKYDGLGMHLLLPLIRLSLSPLAHHHWSCLHSSTDCTVVRGMDYAVDSWGDGALVWPAARKGQVARNGRNWTIVG